MQTRLKPTLIIATLFFIGLFLLLKPASSQTCSGREDCASKIGEYEQKLGEIRKQKDTLASEIQYMDTQIYVATLRIKETEHAVITTEEEVADLGGKIGALNESLDRVSEVLLAKIVEGYKSKHITVFDVLLDSNNATTFARSLKYLKVTQDTDRQMAFRVQQTKVNFEEQKQLREQKIQELDALKIQLDQQQITLNNQKQSKQQLLAVTRNDERTYQTLLERARSEYAAIQAIVTGAGVESELRSVSKGDVIANVIQGASCNSSGTHLHFIVKEGDTIINPFSKLKNVDYDNKTGGDDWSPSGDWDWPLSPRIGYHQGYGETWCVRFGICGRIYNSHNGLDISGSSSSVYAVSAGKLYKGAFSGGSGCTLPYVKLVHDGSNFTTYYLHVIPR